MSHDPPIAGDHPVAGDYRFQDDPHTAAIVCTHVLTDGRPVLMVTHDPDGYWQFLCGQDHPDASEGRLVGLGHIVDRDPSLDELASMCTGHHATRAAVGASWTIEDKTLENIRRAIVEYGWWVGAIPEEADLPAFAYTIGLTESFQHPELILFGLAPATMQQILNVCGDRVREGTRFAAGQTVRGILEGHEVRFRAVSDEASHAEYLGYARRHYVGQRLSVLQCLWPDKAGKFPGEPDAASFLATAQPLIP